MNVYQEHIECLTKYQIQAVPGRIKMIISKCQQFAAKHKEHATKFYSKLIIFIEKSRLNYISDLHIAYTELIELEDAVRKIQQQKCINVTNQTSLRVTDLKQCIYGYKQKAKNYLDENQTKKAIKVYRESCTR